MKQMNTWLVFALVALLSGCDVGKAPNTILPATAVVDAVYAPNATRWLNAKLGKPKAAETVEFTYWHDEKAANYNNRGMGYASLVIDGTERIRPVDNIGGYKYSSSQGFKIAFDGKVWNVFVATSELSTHDANPGEFFSDALAVLEKY
jgi:hypothetical protein